MTHFSLSVTPLCHSVPCTHRWFSPSQAGCCPGQAPDWTLRSTTEAWGTGRTLMPRPTRPARDRLRSALTPPGGDEEGTGHLRRDSEARQSSFSRTVVLMAESRLRPRPGGHLTMPDIWGVFRGQLVACVSASSELQPLSILVIIAAPLKWRCPPSYPVLLERDGGEVFCCSKKKETVWNSLKYL